MSKTFVGSAALIAAIGYPAGAAGIIPTGTGGLAGAIDMVTATHGATITAGTAGLTATDIGEPGVGKVRESFVE